MTVSAIWITERGVPWVSSRKYIIHLAQSLTLLYSPQASHSSSSTAIHLGMPLSFCIIIHRANFRWTQNSVYSLWPFFTPQKMTESLTRQGIAAKYTFERPKPQSPPVILTTFTAISTVWSDSARFKNTYPKAGYGSALNYDDPSM